LRTYHGPTIKAPKDVDWAQWRKDKPEKPLAPRPRNTDRKYSGDYETVAENRQRHRERILRLFPEYAVHPNQMIDRIGTGPSSFSANNFFGVPLQKHRTTLRKTIKKKKDASYTLHSDTLVQPSVPHNHKFFPNMWMLVRKDGINPSQRGPEYKEITFKTAPNMGKKDIEAYLKSIYKMDVVQINTANYEGAKSYTGTRGYLRKKPDWKKVWVTARVDPAETEGISFQFANTKKKPKNIVDPVMKPADEEKASA